MTAATTNPRTHHDGCWRYHDECALQRARLSLANIGPSESTVRTRDLLAVVRMAIRDHPHAPCPGGANCFAVHQARQFLASQ